MAGIDSRRRKSKNRSRRGTNAPARNQPDSSFSADSDHFAYVTATRLPLSLSPHRRNHPLCKDRNQNRRFWRKLLYVLTSKTWRKNKKEGDARQTMDAMSPSTHR
jgi:hypothetical protein